MGCQGTDIGGQAKNKSKCKGKRKRYDPKSKPFTFVTVLNEVIHVTYSSLDDALVSVLCASVDDALSSNAPRVIISSIWMKIHVRGEELGLLA